MIDSKVLESSKEEYKKLLNKAYVESASGIYSYEESIRHCVNNLASSGILLGHYSGNRSMSIESIVRRDIITRINKTVGENTLENCKTLGTNLVYVDQHPGARVRTEYMKEDYEAHAEWQGKKYMIDGSNDKYDNLYEKTGYGEMLGLYGINCYHNMRPTFEWEEISKQIDEKENARIYELNQKQRLLERNKRKHARLYRTTQNDEDKRKFRKKLAKDDAKLDKFAEENGLTRKYDRERIG